MIHFAGRLFIFQSFNLKIMKSIIQYFAALLTMLLFFKTSFAQQQNESQGQALTQNQTPQPQVPVSAVKKTTATVLGGLVFAPRLHYYGRTDQLTSNAVLPTINIQFDSIGIYASATSVLISNKQQTLDYAGTIAEAGYRFGKFTGFNGNVYGNKFFYNTTQLPQSALDEQVGTNLNFNNKLINITATGSAAFSDERTDYFASGGLNKNFKWKRKKGVFVVTPTYVLNAGSQNFTNVKYKENLGTPVTGTDEEIFENNRSFKILSHEFSVPLIYARKHIYFIITPSYIIPENLVMIPNHPELSETGKNLFYANVTVLYTFKL